MRRVWPTSGLPGGLSWPSVTSTHSAHLDASEARKWAAVYRCGEISQPSLLGPVLRLSATPVFNVCFNVCFALLRKAENLLLSSHLRVL